MLDAEISKKDLYDLLQKDIIDIDVIAKAYQKKVDEVLVMNKVEIPKINSRTKGNCLQYYTTMPAKYSYNGSRHQIVANSEEEVVSKFKKEAYHTLTKQEDVSRYENATVTDIVIKYLEFAKGNIKMQTYNRYYRSYRNYILNTEFGNMKISNVKKYHCDDYVRTLTNGSIVFSYVSQIKCIVSQAFDYACDRDIMSWNYMRKVKINESMCKQESGREITIWEDEEIMELQKASKEAWLCKKYKHSAVIFILCGTGMRIGELLALKWEDVDFENRLIKITKTQTEYTDYVTNSKIYEVSTTKNKTSRRTIVVNDFTLYWLSELEQRTGQLKEQSEYVVSTRNGKMVKESTLCVSLQKFCNYAGVTYKSTHTCRRSYVTTCLDNDMKLAQVSANVGHKNKSTTLNTYYKCKNNFEDNMEIQNKIFNQVYGNLATVGNT